MIRLKFNNAESRDAFATRFKLDSKVDTTELDIDWHLLQFAKVDDNCVDYDDLEDSQEQEFVVKGDPTKFAALATVVQDLGGGFYHVKSTDGTLLGDFVDSIEHTSSAVKLLGSLETMDAAPIANLDPTTSENQWARLRVISKYRPLAKSFGIHDVTYNSTPELIIMDSGINFDHPEFDYPELQKENFFTLPDFNGEYGDDVGHGTAVASCAVGKNLGVASHVKLVNVKIGNANRHATLIELGSAIDAILTRVTSAPTVTRIVNMSWCVARSAWLDSKVQSLLDAGVTVICAAGNNGISVEDVSPAGIDNVITVGSIDKFDIPSGYNNISPTDANITTGHGLSLDIFAPGEHIITAWYKGGYIDDCGTSFSAPYVAGVAAVIASLYKSIVPYNQLKELVLSTATSDALLFEDNRFSENQNRLVYLPIADINVNQKTNNVSSYLGYLSEDIQTLEVNIKTIMSMGQYQNWFSENPTYKLKFLDSEQESKYSSHIVLDSEGKLTITYPNFDMPESTKFVIVEFVLEVEIGQLKMVSPTIFFYDTNRNYKASLETDIGYALTQTNSVSFYAASFSIK